MNDQERIEDMARIRAGVERLDLEISHLNEKRRALVDELKALQRHGQTTQWNHKAKPGDPTPQFGTKRC